MRRLGVPGWARDVGTGVALLLALMVGLVIGVGSADRRAPASAPVPSAQAATWTCSMHPQIRLPQPGPCPICGMDLIPLLESESAAPTPTEVVLSDRAKALAKITTAAVVRAEATVELRLLGRFEHAETLVRTVTPWTAGRVDRLFVSHVGARISRGAPIASLYSPEIYSAHQDLIQAKRQVDRLGEASPSAIGAATSALASARQRLALLGLKPADLRAMEAEEKPRQQVKIRSSYGGTVLEQLVHQGAYVDAGTPLYRVADLSKLWVQLDAYESDLASVQVGQSVELTVSSYPGEKFAGAVAFVDPVVDPKNRTARVRVEVSNADGRLSPGMFADAIIYAKEGAADAPLVIPETAPLFTGKRSIVYVERTDRDRPTYAAREVHLGPRAGGVYPVVAGLDEGERVVVRGAFALDSDLQIRGGQSTMSRPDDVSRDRRASTAAASDHGHEPPEPTPAVGSPTAVRSNASRAEKPSAPTTASWTCPMHPQVESSSPGSCPICKMDLVPRKPGPKAPAGHGH